MSTLFERVFAGSDGVYAAAQGVIDDAIAKAGADAAIKLDTAYSLPCYYAVTGVKVSTLGEMKEALEGTVKSLMTREKRTKDIFTSGVGTALAAEMIEAVKYTVSEESPYQAPVQGHFTDAQIRELGVPLVTGDIPGIAVILGAAPTAEQCAKLVQEYQSEGIFVTLVGGCIDQ